MEHRDHVYRLALRLTGGCQVEAEDVTQDALIAALTRLPFFLGKSRMTTWLYTITVRTWRARQQQRYRQELPLPEKEVAGDDDWNAHLTRLDLDQAIRNLPNDLSEAFVLVKA
jgi:RNA polymerase sigma-70 factor, ECF subfamily